MKKLLLIWFLMFALINAEVLTLRGDMKMVTGINAETYALESGSISVDPVAVPRDCVVYVKGLPYSHVNVYYANGVYSGISCSTVDNGICSFSFNWNNPAGTYYIKADNSPNRVEVQLIPSLACYSDIKSIELVPNKSVVNLGDSIVLSVNAYDLNNFPRSVAPSFQVPAEVGYDKLSLSSIRVSPRALGNYTIKAIYHNVVDEAKIVVVPGKCDYITAKHPDQIRIGDGYLEISGSIRDQYNNLKSNREVKLTYLDENGNLVELKTNSSQTGRFEFEMNVGTVVRNIKFNITTNAECGENYSSQVSALAGYPNDIVILPQKYAFGVGQSVDYMIKAYDEYGNEFSNYTVSWYSYNPNVFTITTDGHGEALYPGHAKLRAIIRYDVIDHKRVCYLGVCNDFENVENKVVKKEFYVRVYNGIPSSLVVSPVSLSTMAGVNTQFKAKVYDIYGAEIKDANIHWSSDIGTIDENGLFYSGEVTGEGHVYIDYGTLHESVPVRVTPGKLGLLKVEPQEVRVHYGETTNVLLDLEDIFGNPIPNANINLEVANGCGSISANVITDNNGLATATYYAPGNGNREDPLFLRSECNAKIKAIHDSLSNETNIKIYLNPPKIDGFVYDIYGNPVQSVKVGYDNGFTYTDANGHYELTLPVGRVYLNATKTNYLGDDYSTNTLRDGVYHHNFNIVPKAIVEVHVINETNLDLENANISIYDSTNGDLVNSTITDASGHASLDVYPNGLGNNYLISVRAEHYDESNLGTLIQPGDHLVLTFKLGGYDVTPPEIYFVNPTPADGTYQKGVIDVAVVASDPNLDRIEINDGHNIISSCNTNSCSLQIDSTNYNDGQLTIQAVAYDTHGQQSSISRTFMIDNINPAVEFLVPPTPNNASEISGMVTIEVDANDATGIEKIELYIGNNLVDSCLNQNSCQFQVDSSNYVGNDIPVRAIAYSYYNSNFSEFVYNITPLFYPNMILAEAVPNYIGLSGSSTIIAHVYDNTDMPMVGERVDVSGLGSFNVTSALTDNDGKVSFEFQPLTNGNLTISLTAGNIRNETYVYVADFSGPGDLEGMVSDKNGNPIPNAEISLILNGNVVATTNSDANGHYNIHIDGGIYELYITSAGYVPVLDSEVIIEKSKVTVKDYELEELSNLYGYVYDEDTNPVEQANVSVYRNGIYVNSTLTDVNGYYSFDLREGVYFVQITKNGYIDSMYTVYLQAGTTLQKDVILYR